MAVTLFCKRLLESRPKLFRNLCKAGTNGHALPRLKPDNLQFQSLPPINSCTKNATSELDEMKDGNAGGSSFSLAEPNIIAFNRLIQIYCEDLQYQQAVEAISTQMKALGVEAVECFYKQLGDDLCAFLGPISAFQLLQKLRANHIEVPIPYYNALISDLHERIMLNDVDVVVFVKEQQQDEGFASFIEEFCSSFSREDLPEAICTLKSRMSADGIKLRISRLNSFLGCLGKYGLLEEAVKLLNEYRERSDFKLDNASYGYALDYCSKLGNMDEAVNLFKEMKAQMMHPDLVHYNALLKGYQRLGRLDHIRTTIAAEMEKVNLNWCSS